MSTSGAAQNSTSGNNPRVGTPSPCSSDVSKCEVAAGATNKEKDEAAGGRLKFFIDGKMVLELSDRQENGKTCWVPIVQKTYWPPPAASCSTPGSSARQGSSTSYSLSDDSSIHSLPCLRETRWKNPNPSRRIAQKEEESVHFRIRHREQCRYQWSQRRRPFQWLQECHMTFKKDCVECKYRWKKKGLSRPNITMVTSRLLERNLKKKLTLQTQSIMADRSSALISPRKRLLREMEKVRLHDRSSSPSCNTLKKAKAVGSIKPLPMLSILAPTGSHSSAQTKAYDRQSSYSIDSLLNNREHSEDDSSTANATSSFLRSLLGNAPLGISAVDPSESSPISAVKTKSPASSAQQRIMAPPSNLLLPLALRMASPHVLHPSVWLPYVHTSSSFPPSTFPSPLASSLSTAALTLAARPGPSGSESQSGTFGGRMPTPPDDCDEDDAPLNLTTTKDRDYS